MTSVGKYRRLSTLATARGAFTILAVDHRDSLRQVLDPDDPARVPPERLTDLKLGIMGAIGNAASAVLIDPEYSIAPAIQRRVLPGDVGFIAAIEQQGYLGDPSATETTLLPDWGVAKAARVGASGVKLLVLYNPGAGAITEHQERLIGAVVSDCRRHEVPLFLEPLVYSHDPALPVSSPDFPRRQVVIETVARLGALHPDVLKVQFPTGATHRHDEAEWLDACTELTATSPVPWALLSGGDPYDSFVRQLTVACEAGASGFLVGRALWREAAHSAHRAKTLEEVVKPRFDELVAITESARPWWDAVDAGSEDTDWYRRY